MDIGLFCMWCGGRLGNEDGNVACPECGTEFSNMLVSETKYEDQKNSFLEMSVSMDCIKVKERCPQQIYPVAIEKAATVYD